MKNVVKNIFIIFIFIFLFMIDSSVYASKTCDYVIGNDPLSGAGASGTLTISDKNKASFKVTLVNGSKKNNSEKVLNWDSIKDTYISNGKCPDYAVFYTDSSYKIYLFYDKTEADNFLISKKWCDYITPGKVDEFCNTKSAHLATSNEYIAPDEVSNKYYKYVEEYLIEAKAMAEKEYSIDQCNNDFVECEHKVSASMSVLSGHKSEVNSYVASHFISSSDSKVVDFYNYYDTAKKKADNFKKLIIKTRNGEVKPGDPGSSSNVDLGHDIEETCDGILGKDFINFLNDVFKWIKIIVPILVIVLGSVDFAGSLLQDDKDAMKKATSKFIKRLLVAVAIFLLTFILTFILNIFNKITGAGTTVCEVGMINLIK